MARKSKKTGIKKDFPGYPHYPENQDVFNHNDVDLEKDPENKKENKPASLPREGNNELDFSTDKSGSDLDVPGAELDDLQESLGSEDEENNYYSLGGDNHENQEEQNGKT